MTHGESAFQAERERITASNFYLRQAMAFVRLRRNSQTRAIILRKRKTKAPLTAALMYRRKTALAVRGWRNHADDERTVR